MKMRLDIGPIETAEDTLNFIRGAGLAYASKIIGTQRVVAGATITTFDGLTKLGDIWHNSRGFVLRFDGGKLTPNEFSRVQVEWAARTRKTLRRDRP